MKQEESYPWAEIPILGLQPVKFKPVASDPRLAVYQALIKSPAPDMPTFSLTVTTASPGDDQQAERELQSLLSNMRAGVLVADGGPVQDAPDDPEPFNPDTQIEIRIEPVEPVTTERTFGVIMVIQTAVDSGPEAEAEADLAAPAAAPRSNYRVPQRKEHKYTANHAMIATVTAISGSGRLRPPGGPVSAGDSTSTNNKRRTVFVRGNPLEFYLTAGFTDRGLV
jgi:hypothetical protein